VDEQRLAVVRDPNHAIIDTHLMEDINLMVATGRMRS